MKVSPFLKKNYTNSKDTPEIKIEQTKKNI